MPEFHEGGGGPPEVEAVAAANGATATTTTHYPTTSPTGRITDPTLAAEITLAARKRARELVAEGPFPREVLERVAALIGPIPKARQVADAATR